MTVGATHHASGDEAASQSPASVPWPQMNLLSALPAEFRSRVTDAVVPQPLADDVEGTLLLEPAALLARDAERPMPLRVTLEASGASKWLLTEAGSLRPLLWCASLGREVKPLSISEPQLGPGSVSWDLVLPGVAAPATLEVTMGHLGDDGHVQQTLPIGAFAPVIGCPNLQHDILLSPEVSSDLCAVMDAAILRVPSPQSLQSFLEVAEGLAEFAEEEGLRFLQGEQVQSAWGRGAILGGLRRAPPPSLAFFCLEWVLGPVTILTLWLVLGAARPLVLRFLLTSGTAVI